MRLPEVERERGGVNAILADARGGQDAIDELVDCEMKLDADTARRCQMSAREPFAVPSWLDRALSRLVLAVRDDD